MKTGSIFSASRLFRLSKRHFLHNYKVLLTAILVGFGISFLIIAFLQFMNGANQSGNTMFIVIGVLGYALLGGFYISSSFSYFRNKEKAQDYLMLPGTALEKYLVEFVFYPLLYLLLFPMLYLLAYELSTSFISIIKPHFIPFNLKEEFYEILVLEGYYTEDGVPITSRVNFLILWVTSSFSLAMAFFLGASAFKKQVMLKTLLGLAIYFGLCSLLLYYLMVELKWSNYDINDTKTFLSPIGSEDHSPKPIINFFSYWILSWGILFSVVSFFKLKEKEV
ncbi:hypothetical protein DSM03_1011066 [Leeuwenhoekiella aestuarii]|uniref:ABC-2 type transport system permease protein n=1 Tax=Leeuwenhoekiella aestuarii TaxID=2249426 RepID=A0A4Q0NZJ1_9FLAO|nr:hypothetical protein [Leeuwenhoekiella aestuarii]RXG18384.1 hypothetical protein DSM04_101577 [Leeuwenhoekiella aestuarii]RXG19689.1 hypothetical protein DSM03_1011066 [Leeuwenhoekiella aestuarii]